MTEPITQTALDDTQVCSYDTGRVSSQPLVLLELIWNVKLRIFPAVAGHLAQASP